MGGAQVLITTSRKSPLPDLVRNLHTQTTIRSLTHQVIYSLKRPARAEMKGFLLPVAPETTAGGGVSGNNKVWKKLNVTAVTTSKITVTVNSALNSRSRIVELEAWGTAAATAALNVA
jgi:hypothetical protein